MVNRSVILVGLLIAASGNVYGQQSMAVLDTLVAAALRDNPQLKAARAEVEAAKSGRKQATAWEAPQAGIEFYQAPTGSFPNPFKDQMEYDYFFQQTVPFPGKLAAMAEAAQSNAEMTRQGYRALENKVIRDLKSAFFELYLVQRKMEINDENQALMTRLVEIAIRQNAAGIGQQPDILRAQSELSTLVTERINLSGEEKRFAAMINTMLSRPADVPIGRLPEIGILPAPWSFVQLQPLAQANRAELQAMRNNISMRQAEFSLAKKEYYPDLMARLMYKDMANSTKDFWSAMVSINLPVAFWSAKKYSAGSEAGQMLVRKSEADYDNMRNMISFEVQDALVKVQTNYNLASLYKSTVLQQAEQMLQSTLTTYQTGRTEFLMLMDACRVVLNAKLGYQMAVMNYMVSMAQLEQAIGLPMEEIRARVH